MGSIGRLFTAGAEHIRAQSKVDAGRIVQAAYNRNQISLSDAKTLLQTVNNAAAKDWASAQTAIRDANNYATSTITSAQNRLIDAQNTIASGLTEVQNKYAVFTATNQNKLLNQQNELNIKTTAASNAAAQGIAASNTATSAGIAGAQKQVQDFRNATAVDVALAQRKVQAARNERAAAETTLALWSQSVANQHLLDEAGDRITAVQEDAAKRFDQSLVGRISDRLKGAEALGASLAQAGAAGLGGATVESFAQDIRLREALKEEAEDRQIAATLYAAGQQRGALLEGAVGQMDGRPVIADMDYSAIVPEGQDFTPIAAQKFVADTQVAQQSFGFQTPELQVAGQNYDKAYAALDFTPFVADQDYEVFQPNLDYTVYVDHKKMSFLQKFLTVGAAGVATYFGGPAAGGAVLDASFAINDAQNGNFGAAMQGFNSSASGFTSAYKNYQKTGNQPWASTMFKSSPSGANLKV
ncbi:hypothetical protein CPT_Percy42 [Caulobacter phage Percy]|uniref:Uncharacterized protein n=1 Tax=Caulobacter phage Percy TaxID=1701809 RepID=A0A0M4RDH8_9CAUD|nr:internal virion protein [Caulobacter phage Percy]ALF01676.1 hypothetical protein CPT_Percy42 [Caulobacter phage Percy]